MKNQNVIDALEQCKKVLVSELRSYVESRPGKEVKCWCPLPVYKQDTYNFEGYWAQDNITKVYVDEGTDVLMAEYETYDEQFCESVEECFNVGEIAKIIDYLHNEEE